MSMKPDQICYLCGKKNATTRDHIPPSCLFIKPKPSDLITVPSCKDCNQYFSKDDEYFRALLVSLEINKSSAAEKIFEEKVIPAFDKSSRFLDRFLSQTKEAEIYSEGGIYLKDGVVIGYEVPRIENVLNKITKGIYYKEKGEILSSEYTVMSFPIDYQFPKEVIDYMNDIPIRYVGDGRIFAYRVCGMKDDNNIIYCFMFFYNSILVTTFTIPVKEAQEIKRKRKEKKGNDIVTSDGGI